MTMKTHCFNWKYTPENSGETLFFSQCSIGNTSSNGGCSIFMFFFGKVHLEMLEKIMEVPHCV